MHGTGWPSPSARYTRSRPRLRWLKAKEADMTRSMNRVAAMAVVVLAIAGVPAAYAEGDKVTPVRSEKLPNVPGKSLTAVVVNYAPGGKSASHHHAGSVFAYVLSGSIRSENSATGPARV